MPNTSLKKKSYRNIQHIAGGIREFMPFSTVFSENENNTLIGVRTHFDITVEHVSDLSTKNPVYIDRSVIELI